MRVITLTQRQLTEECRRLQSMVERAGFTPDCILSIRSGGTYVAREMYHDVPHQEVTLRRRSTGAKRSRCGQLLAMLLRHLPVWLTDRLRILESQRLHSDFHRRYSSQGAVEEAVSEARRRIEGMPAALTQRFSRILVVDDAVDSGLTLKAVLAELRAAAATELRGTQPEIRSAVITVTTPDPIVRPDFYLYPSLCSADDAFTLIRFPWSADAKRIKQ